MEYIATPGEAGSIEDNTELTIIETSTEDITEAVTEIYTEQATEPAIKFFTNSSNFYNTAPVAETEATTEAQTINYITEYTSEPDLVIILGVGFLCGILLSRTLLHRM